MVRAAHSPVARRGPPAGAVEATDRYVGAALRALRVASGLNRREVAARLSVTYPTVHKWERGEIRIFPETLVRVAALFGVEVAELFPGAQILRGGLGMRSRRRRMRQTAAFVGYVRRIPSEALQDSLARVTRLILEGQRTPSPTNSD